MKFLISGGTGFLGSKLTKELLKEHEVEVLTRDTDKFSENIKYITTIDYNKSYDVIINFSGEPIDSKRWTQSQKNELVESRVKSTRRIIEYINDSNNKPKLFINSSAIGYYGISKSDEFTEESQSLSNSFCSEICQMVENETATLNDEKIRIVILRTGVVLDENRGALSKMIIPFRLGLGSVIGNGRQFISWIHIQDYIRAIIEIIRNQDIQGVVNITSPNPVSNKFFSENLAEIVKMPLFLKLPNFMVNLIFGEMGNEILLSGQKVLPKKLLDNGFKFRYNNIPEALNNILDK